MLFQSEEELVENIEQMYGPVYVQLMMGIQDKRINQVKAKAEIRVKPVKAFVEVLVEELESDYIYAEQGESIYSSFGIDERIGIYEEVLTTIPYTVLIENENWRKEINTYVTEEQLKGALEKLLNDYQFTDPSGKYRFRKICSIQELAIVSE
ncbi:hypothetical protein D1953_16450 [Peribacillus asahii]|uniref:Uncharacterized protein n=1 Tax=Peribacillus asahii TaxID=228899 RepID=A0A398B096_9BACI|nr:hypothetical protein [Peribacillus asahii]RID83339.1 hypothetical protein D1953_16450 [Peribacillus asahii]